MEIYNNLNHLESREYKVLWSYYILDTSITLHSFLASLDLKGPRLNEVGRSLLGFDTLFLANSLS
jgi:hypothetical protein